MVEIAQKNIEDESSVRWFEATINKKIVGFAIARVKEGVLSLDTIHIEAWARGQKIGTNLLKSAFKWGKDQGALEIVGEFWPEGGKEERKKVQGFYAKHGIVVDENNGLRGKIDHL
ncbi:GNAT family N-acetyltransferase [Patescibacteria group bacterium]